MVVVLPTPFTPRTRKRLGAPGRSSSTWKRREAASRPLRAARKLSRSRLVSRTCSRSSSSRRSVAAGPRSASSRMSASSSKNCSSRAGRPNSSRSRPRILQSQLLPDYPRRSAERTADQLDQLRPVRGQPRVPGMNSSRCRFAASGPAEVEGPPRAAMCRSPTTGKDGAAATGQQAESRRNRPVRRARGSAPAGPGEGHRGGEVGTGSSRNPPRRAGFGRNLQGCDARAERQSVAPTGSSPLPIRLFRQFFQRDVRLQTPGQGFIALQLHAQRNAPGSRDPDGLPVAQQRVVQEVRAPGATLTRKTPSPGPRGPGQLPERLQARILCLAASV
jgi:hypothetical protein